MGHIRLQVHGLTWCERSVKHARAVEVEPVDAPCFRASIYKRNLFELVVACERKFFSRSQLIGVAGVETADDATDARREIGSDPE